MDHSAIFAKSDKGRHEIESHARALSRNARYILILIDGKSSLEQLLSGGALFHNLEEEIEHLWQSGYIVRVNGPNAAPETAGLPSAMPLTAQIGGKISEDARQIIEREFAELVGPIAGMLCEEAFASIDSVDEVLQLLSKELDETQARQFWQRVNRRLSA